jgi:type I restriction enzyme S subunit
MSRTASLGDLVTIVGGGTPSRSHPEFFGGVIPWITSKDMKRWDLHSSLEYITQQALNESAARLVPAGSVLIVIRSGILKHTLPIGIARRQVAINQDLKALIPREGLDAEYLARYIQSCAPTILQWVRATTADNFPLEELKSLEVYLPEYREQRRVAQTLSRTDHLRRARRYALQVCDEFLPAAFLEMIGDPNKSNWPREDLGELISGLEGGINFSPVHESAPASEWRVLKISAVTNGQFRPQESKAISPNETFDEKLVVREGDLLMSRANTLELVGCLARVRSSPPKVLLPDKLWRIRFRPDTLVLPDYLLYLLRTKALRHEIEVRSSGTSGSMKNISKEETNLLPIPIPPLETQQQFERLVAAHVRHRSTHVEALRQADHLFHSLLHEAFA